MSYDILIYAVVAALICWRLWAVLGRRNEEDRARPNPFDPPPALTPLAADPPKPAGDVPVLPPILTLAPTSLEGGIAQLKTLDPAFDERDFLRQARLDFNTIIEDFAAGDLTRCAAKLGPAVRQNFEAAIANRKRLGQVLQNKITRMVEVETTAVKIEGTRASVTVRFVSDQQNTLRDAEGRIIGGAEGRVEEITDLWSFARDTAVAGSPWLLAETKS